MFDFRSLPTYEAGFHDDFALQKMCFSKLGSTGLTTSLLGFGAAGLALCYGDTEKEQEGIETVVKALKNGINYIDTAPFYGQGKSEIILGKALKSVPRHTYYLATKVGRYGPDVSNLFDFSAARTFQSVEESLSRLGVDYVDILQVHDLEFAPSIDIIVNETLPALQKIKESGKARFIGITGYRLEKLKDVLEASQVPIDVVLSYCHQTLFDESLERYTPYFKSKGIGIIHAAGLGMGLFTKKGPADWHPGSMELKTLCREATGICIEEGVDISKIALVHSLSNLDINIHLVGMEKKNMLKKNLSAFECSLKGLTEREKIVLEKIRRKFHDCQETDWEDKDVKKYWEAMKNISSCN